MFDLVRKHTKVLMAVMFMLIIPSFVLVGVGSYNSSHQNTEAVARVDGQDITRYEWESAHTRESDQLRTSMPSLDPKVLDTPEARYATLERMVRDRVLLAASAKAGLVTSNSRLARELQSNEAVAALRKPDGSLDMDRYRQLLGQQGMTPEMFENEMRREIATRQVMIGLASSSFSPKAIADTALNAYFERREVQLANFATTDFAAKLSVTDAEIESFYKDNPALFQAPEQASIEYVVLDLDTVRKSIVVSEADMKSYYDQNAERLSGKEERRASHILITAPKSAPVDERQKAKAKAEALLADVRKAPTTFAAVAKANSQDPGSAANGGDLDFFSRGAMVKPFEDTVFGLKKGDISAVVETDFGYHIIQLTDIKLPKQRSFEEMKADIEDDLKKQQAQRKFAETAEAFSNGVYEQSDNLKNTAERLKLELKTAANVLRTPAPGAKGPLANTKFLNAIFGPDATEKKRNTEAIEIGSNQLASGRVVQYTPARTRPLTEVKDQARQLLLAQRGSAMARKEGEEKLAAWKAAPASAVVAAPVLVGRNEASGVAPQIAEAVLRSDASKLPALVGVDLGRQGYAVVRINKVLPREAVDAARATQERELFNQRWTTAEGMAYYNLLKDRFKVQIKVPRPEARDPADAPAQAPAPARS